MDRFSEKQGIDIQLVVGWLRSTGGILNKVIETILLDDSCRDEFIDESLKKAEIDLRQIRTFINAN